MSMQLIITQKYISEVTGLLLWALFSVQERQQVVALYLLVA